MVRYRVKEESVRDVENSAAATDVSDESLNASQDPRIVQRMSTILFGVFLFQL